MFDPRLPLIMVVSAVFVVFVVVRRILNPSVITDMPNKRYYLLLILLFLIAADFLFLLTVIIPLLCNLMCP